MGRQSSGIDHEVVSWVADEIKEVHALGVQMAVVVGGGNIIRGVSAADRGIDRVTGDHMGMLATVINALALQDALEKGRVVILAAGTGNPYFTTDSAAALRANELRVDVLLKATQVDGIYDRDPRRDPAGATLLREVSYQQVLERNLRVMDAAAISLCRDNHMPIVVFDLHQRGNIRRVICGESVGSTVREVVSTAV